MTLLYFYHQEWPPYSYNHIPTDYVIIDIDTKNTTRDPQRPRSF